MTAKQICAPWTQEQVDALNKYQQNGWMHPFTCGGDRMSRDHKDGGLLIATVNGWVCAGCRYTQNWAYDWMFLPRPW